VRVSALRVRASVDAFVYAKPPCKGYRPALWYAVAAVCRISSKHHFRFICIIIICTCAVRCMSVLDVQRTTCVQSIIIHTFDLKGEITHTRTADVPTQTSLYWRGTVADGVWWGAWGGY